VLAENPTAPVVAFAADLLGTQGKLAEAQTVLAQLDSLELEPGSRELILAEFQRSHGTPEECDRWYQEAIAANPNFPAAWRRYLAFLVYTKPMDDVIDALEKAFAACPDDASFATLSQHRELLSDVKKFEEDLAKLGDSGRTEDAEKIRDLRIKTRIAPPLVLAAIESPDGVDQAIRALETVRDENGEELAIQLRQLSDTYPSFLRLKMQLARIFGAIGRHREAADLASRAMADFPSEVEPAFLAAESYAALGEWANALDAAKQWRSRSGSRAEAADMQIAEAQIQLGQPSAALETVQPYVHDTSQDSSAYSPAVVQQARALAGSGRIEEAASILEPRLGVSAPWRMAWVRLAAIDITSPTESAAWLGRVAPLVPEDSVDERITLASAWYKIGTNDDYRENARAIIQGLANRPDVTAGTALKLALTAEQHKDYETAEANYRKALQLEPNNAIANNNLAMCLVTTKEPSQEPVELAKKAVEAQPNISSFHDTLAQAYAAIGNFEAAAQSQNRALELSPAKQEFRVRLQEYRQRERETQSPVSGLVP
jgi:tetratricopeptide (TPR) repeat protein